VRQTSHDAHDALLCDLPRMRRMVLAAIRSAGEPGLTADEAAAAIGVSVLSTRPRCTELSAEHAIIVSGRRRPNSSGRRAIVWVAIR
jgi:hypothetical protein